MAFDFSRPGASVAKGLSNATGIDEDKIKKASAVVDPMGSLIHGTVTPKELGGYAKGLVGDLTKTAPVYDAKDPAMVGVPKAPTSGAGSAPVTIKSVAPMTSTTIGAVAPVAGPSFAGSAPATQMQGSLAQQLAAQTRGEGLSLASEQLKQAQDANLAATFSMMASQRGGPTAAGTRTAMNTAADINAQAARDAAMARIKEQTEAQGLLAGVTAGMRTGDVAEQKLATDVSLQNMQAELQRAVAQGQLDQRTAETIYATEAKRATDEAQLAQQHAQLMAQYTQMGMTAEQANQRAQIDMEAIRSKIPMAPSTLDQIGKGLSTMGPIVSMFNPAAGAAVSVAGAATPGVGQSLSSYDNRQNADAQAATDRTGTLYPTR